MRFPQIASRVDWNLLVILALPCLQLSVYQGWIFASSQLIDAGVYLGYLFRFEQHLKAFAGTYYGTRLSWILPGHLVYQVFSPVVANYVLHLGVYYLAAISLYLILKHHIGWRTGLITAVAMGCYPYFILAVGWDYVDGVGLAYCLLTMLMLTYASTANWWQLSSFLSGFFYGALIFSNITWIFCMPVLLVYYLSNNWLYQKRSLITIFLFSLTGFVTITLSLSLINYWINRDFLFYLPSLNFALNTVGKPNPFWEDWSIWLPRAAWLLLPIFVFIGSTLLLWLNRARRLALSSLVVMLQCCFILFFSIQTILELKGAIFLQTYYYASYSIPFLFLAIGSQLSNVLERLRKFELGLALFLPIFISITFLLAYPAADSWPPYYPTLAFSYCGLYLMGLCSLLLIHTRTTRKVAIVAGLVLILTLITPVLTTASLSQDLERKNQQEEEYLATIDASKILQTIDPEVQLVFWYDLDEANVYRAIASTYLWGYRLIGEEFPSLSSQYVTIEQAKRQLQLHPKVVILSKRSNPLSQSVMQSLSKIGFQAKSLASYSINRGQQSFIMTIIEVSKISLSEIQPPATMPTEVKKL